MFGIIESQRKAAEGEESSGAVGIESLRLGIECNGFGVTSKGLREVSGKPTNPISPLARTNA
jgi:hypothetical protein